MAQHVNPKLQKNRGKRHRNACFFCAGVKKDFVCANTSHTMEEYISLPDEITEPVWMLGSARFGTVPL
jgi:hypothetical protein